MEMMSTYPTGWRDPLCISRVPVDRRDTNGCQWWPASPGVPIYLLGDSNALHFSDSIIAAGEQLGRSVAALGSDGCPFADVYLERTSDPSLRIQCRAAYEAMLKWVVEKPHGLVVIASVDRYWRDSDYLVGEDASMRGAEIRMNAVRMNSGLRATVEILLKTGHSVVLMQTIPHFVAPPYRIEETPCNGWSIAFGECQLPAGAMPIEFANALQRMSRDGIREISRDTGAFVFDLRDYFCVAGICSTKSADGEDYYMRDGYHLNQLGSSRLKDKFAAYLSGLPNRQ